MIESLIWSKSKLAWLMLTFHTKTPRLSDFGLNQAIHICNFDSESDDFICFSNHNRTSDDDNKQWLRVGNVIQFFKPTTTSGQGRPLEATITAIHPNEECYTLTLELQRINVYAHSSQPNGQNFQKKSGR